MEAMPMRPIVSAILPTAALLAATPASGGPPKREAQPPNVIFILADDLGYGDLGCYGQRRIKTPNLDRLAAQGVRFTQCYAGSTVCAPSRCCLMTGLHTGHAWVRGNALVPLRHDERTVAHVFRSAGYKTALVGKWGLGEPGTTGAPNRQGFDFFFGYLNQAAAHNSFPTELWRNETIETILENRNGRRGAYSNDLFTSEALSFLDSAAGSPFFLYLAYTAPHANSTARTMEAPEIEPQYRDTDWPETEKLFASTITRMDRDIGRIMDRLGRLGIGRNTLIFFTSDNGPHREGGHSATFFGSSGPLRGIKRDLYEGGIRVPMIVRWPARIKPGTVSKEPWALWDFLPTVCELTGVACPPGLDGVSVMPALLGGHLPVRPPMYWEFHEGGFSQAARMGDWKAVRRPKSSTIELYALNNDPGETKNIADKHPEVLARMADYLQHARTDSAEFPVRP
jgi:arylsulfatase A-like enzyme